jgi:hypothetical protein
MAATRPLARDGMAKGTFRSLKVFNYRLWAVGSLDRMSLCADFVEKLDVSRVLSGLGA